MSRYVGQKHYWAKLTWRRRRGYWEFKERFELKSTVKQRMICLIRLFMSDFPSMLYS
jgi:hypothetical protein